MTTFRTARPQERGALLALVESGLRRPGAATGPVDDFPLALGQANGDWQLVAEERGELIAALACLVRPCLTSAGELPVAGIGSVVTAPAWQGRGVSRGLQEEVLARLAADGVPLAVLWSDRPELYAARGFAPAGVEYHVGLESWVPPAPPADAVMRRYAPRDEAAVAALHARHPYRTLRRPGEAALLYGMPGTRGWVVEGVRDGAVTAYAFCGKGQDFPGWILEWGGDPAAVALLVSRLRTEAGARRLLAPQGAEAMAAALAEAGATVAAHPSGLWCVTNPARLAAVAPGETRGADPVAWLGGIAGDGQPRPGPLRLAVWGFDSV